MKVQAKGWEGHKTPIVEIDDDGGIWVETLFVGSINSLDISQKGYYEVKLGGANGQLATVVCGYTDAVDVVRSEVLKYVTPNDVFPKLKKVSEEERQPTFGWTR